MGYRLWEVHIVETVQVLELLEIRNSQSEIRNGSFTLCPMLHALCPMSSKIPNLKSLIGQSTPFSYARQATTGRELPIKDIPGNSCALAYAQNEIRRHDKPRS